MTDTINIYKEPCAAIFSGKPLPPPEPEWKSALLELVCAAACILLCVMFACGVIFSCISFGSWIAGFI